MNDALPYVSAVIPSWNRRDELGDCIRSLLRQRGVRLEIIVVDDGSKDGSRERVRAEFPEVVVLGDGRTFGPAHRRNLGVLASHGDYVLQLDSDIEFKNPDAVASMTAWLAGNGDIGSVGGEIAAHAGDFDHVHALRFDKMDRPQRVSGGCDSAGVDCDYLATLCCMMRRSDVLSLGGYDPYGQYGGEDADLGYRFKLAGFRNVACFSCAALHHASNAGRHADASYRFCVAWWRFVIKHRGLFVFLLRLGWYAGCLVVARLRFALRAREGDAGQKQADRIGILRMVMKSGIRNLSQAEYAVRARHANFLTPEALHRFETWKALHS